MQHTPSTLEGGVRTLLPADGLHEALERAAAEHRPLRVKFGIDPSGSELTLGHAVVLRKLRQFQDAGHLAVLVIGDFTATVGDPTGRNTERAMLSLEETRRNAATFLQQACRILDPERIEVRHNTEWLGEMRLGEFFSWSAKLTVAQLLERDDFSKRFAAHTPIALSELGYPLLQGIDSVFVEADVELGGSDQFFNLLVGRDLQRSAGQIPQVVMTMPILAGLDGEKKMSKSAGNFVALEDAPAEQFGKLMSIPDASLGEFARLAAWLPEERCCEIEAIAAAGGPAAGAAKREVARRTVALLHGDAAAAAAEASFDRVFRSHVVPADIPEHVLADSDEVHLPTLLVELGLAASRTASRSLLTGGGVRLDGEVLSSLDLGAGALRGRVLQVGKRRFVRLL